MCSSTAAPASASAWYIRTLAVGGNYLVRRAMQHEGRRKVRVHVLDGAQLPGGGGVVLIVHEQSAGRGATGRAVVAHEEDRRRIYGNARGHIGSHARVAALALEPGLARRACQKQAQMGTGRISRDGDLGGIDAQRLRIGAKPTQRRFDIVNLSRPCRLRREPIFAGDAHKATREELLHLPHHHRSVAPAPAAAVNHQHPGAIRRFRRVDITAQITTAPAPIDCIVLDVHHSSTSLFDVPSARSPARASSQASNGS